MNECLIVKEELILKAQNWINEIKINKISYDHQITDGNIYNIYIYIYIFIKMKD